MKYFGNWTSHDSMAGDFGGEVAPDEQVIFASYGTGSYEGYALVIFERNGELYEVNASHCSCFGLEGKWAPEKTSWPAIGMRESWETYGHDADAMAALKDLVTKAVKP